MTLGTTFGEAALSGEQSHAGAGEHRYRLRDLVGDILETYSLARIRRKRILHGGMFLQPVLVTSDSGRYVLRAHTFRFTERTFRFQAKCLDDLAQQGVRCPRIVRNKQGGYGYPQGKVFWALHEYLDGFLYSWQGWYRLKMGNPEFIKTLGSAAARIHQALQHANPGGDPAFSPDLPPIQFLALKQIRKKWDSDLNRLARRSQVRAQRTRAVLLHRRKEIEKHWARLSEAVAGLPLNELPRQWVHGDLSPVNMVFQKGQQEFGLIDWDCLHLGFPLYDALGDVLNRPPAAPRRCHVFNPEEVRWYLEGYTRGRGRPLSLAETRCVPAFCLARQLEDLRQRLAVLPQLPPERDVEYEALINMRVGLMDQMETYDNDGRPATPSRRTPRRLRP